MMMMMMMMNDDEPYHIHIRLGTTPARVRIDNTIAYQKGRCLKSSKRD